MKCEPATHQTQEVRSRNYQTWYHHVLISCHDSVVTTLHADSSSNLRKLHHPQKISCSSRATVHWEEYKLTQTMGPSTVTPTAAPHECTHIPWLPSCYAPVSWRLRRNPKWVRFSRSHDATLLYIGGESDVQMHAELAAYLHHRCLWCRCTGY